MNDSTANKLFGSLAFQISKIDYFSITLQWPTYVWDETADTKFLSFAPEGVIWEVKAVQWQIGSVAVVIKCRILENPFRLPAGCIQIEEELYVKSGPHATKQRKCVANSESWSFQSSLKGWSDFDKLSEWFSQLFYKLISTILDSIDVEMNSINTCMKVYLHWFHIIII